MTPHQPDFWIVQSQKRVSFIYGTRLALRKYTAADSETEEENVMLNTTLSTIRPNLALIGSVHVHFWRFQLESYFYNHTWKVLDTYLF